MSDGNLNEWDESDFAATRVVGQLDTFLEKFDGLGEVNHLDSVLTGHKTLQGPRVKQQPEVFTSQYLIEPVLHALNFYDPTSDVYEKSEPHFVRQPSTFNSVEQKRPDYHLKHPDERVICFLEAKAANREQMDGAKTAASDDIETYFESDTFCNVERGTEPGRRYLIGIGTDGLRWSLHVKDTKTGATARRTPKADLSPVVESRARKHGPLAGEPEIDWNDQCEHVTESFTSDFEVDSIAESAISLLD